MRFLTVMLTLILAFPLPGQSAGAQPTTLDSPGRQWVDETLGKLSVEEKVGQIITVGGEDFRLLRDEINRCHVGSYYFGARGEAHVPLHGFPAHAAA